MTHQQIVNRLVDFATILENGTPDPKYIASLLRKTADHIQNDDSLSADAPSDEPLSAKIIKASQPE